MDAQIIPFTYTDECEIRTISVDGDPWFVASDVATVLGYSATAAMTRTLDADEIQYQISGTRTLFSQRGVVTLGPGDFVRIPLGIAHASVVDDESATHLSLLSHRELSQVAESTRFAESATEANQVLASGGNR